MADKWPLANGNWSNAANWNGGTKPQAGDTVYADGKTVTIDENTAAVESVRTTQRSGGTAGGSFTLNDGITLTGDCRAGSTNAVTFNSASPAEGFIVGDCYGSTTASSMAGAVNNNTGTLDVTGDALGGSGNSTYGVANFSTGTLNVTGNVTGGSATGASGAHNQVGGSVAIVGAVTGGSGGNVAYGVNNLGTGTVTVTGDAIGGAGNNAHGINNSSSGTVTVTGNLTALTGTYGYNADSDSSVLIHDGNLVSASNGRSGATLRGLCLIHATNTQEHTYRVNNGGSAGDPRTLSTDVGGGKLVNGGLVSS